MKPKADTNKVLWQLIYQLAEKAVISSSDAEDWLNELQEEDGG